MMASWAMLIMIAISMSRICLRYSRISESNAQDHARLITMGTAWWTSMTCLVYYIIGEVDLQPTNSKMPDQTSSNDDSMQGRNQFSTKNILSAPYFTSMMGKLTGPRHRRPPMPLAISNPVVF